MSTVLQLLTNYYEAVIESDRIYHENVNGGRLKFDSGDVVQKDSMLVKETISLRRQIAQLATECNLLKQENEKHKQLHKTQLALLESKLENARKLAPKPKCTTPDNGEEHRKEVHLLSPINKKSHEMVLEHGRVSKLSGATKMSPASQNEGLRNAISKNKPTLFDDDTNEFAENSHEASFLTSIKDKNKLANIVLPKESIASSSDAEDDNNVNDDNERHDANKNRETSRATQKKRRLIKKRIQRADTDSEST
ncbi:LANO_0H12464g1_1 [Lachancea nothofagi CBS 11611]|uniref:LANO_0H12464g1_1 n=1 Tax=Lachancea nothofagi CBS 11611 TaxID=1266666 RepID=A0A1G4KMF0_9SACH|nr:LANO_0H12464g1_1 [Lachancea nothofagi CBS 11611]